MIHRTDHEEATRGAVAQHADLLDILDGLVGWYVATSRPRTPLEERAFGGPGTEGGSGVVVKVGERVTLTQMFAKQCETLTGRNIVVDYGMSWLITADTALCVFPDEAAYLAHNQVLFDAGRASALAEVVARDCPSGCPGNEDGGHSWDCKHHPKWKVNA